MDSPINLPEERYEFSFHKLFGESIYSLQNQDFELFDRAPHLPNPQRALLHGLLSEEEIHDLRSRVTEFLPQMFDSLFAELSLDTLKRYQRMGTKLESLEEEHEHLRTEVARLREIVESAARPSVAKVLERIHNERAGIPLTERETLLKKAAGKRALAKQHVDQNSILEQVENFVRAEVEDAPDQDY